MNTDPANFSILNLIIEKGFQPGDRLPTIQQISEESGISVSRVREALEVARVLGFVEIRPGRGTLVSTPQLSESVKLLASYLIGLDEKYFFSLRDLRNAIESHYWEVAVRALSHEQVTHLRKLIATAFTMLENEPIQIPMREHREFHLSIFAGVENIFIQGILEAFWDIYDAFGYSLYQDLQYHRTVWSFHDQIVDAIATGNFERGRVLYLQHLSLIPTRSQPPINASRANRPSIFE